MAFEFKLPDIGEGVHEGEIAKWLVSSGQSIQEDQPMVEVMTDKVTVEITSPVSGTVQELLYKEGQTVKVGSVIIKIDEVGASSKKESPTTAQVANGSKSTPSTTPESVPAAITSRSSDISSSRVLAAPAVRKLARAMGVDLALITGTGPQGRIRKTDVLSMTSEAAVSSRPMAPTRVVGEKREERVPFMGMRRKIAEHLVKSKQTVPHFTYVEEADMSAIVNMRDELLPHAQNAGIKLTFLPFIMKAVVEGLKQYPKLNSTLDETTQEIVLKHYYNLGMAVATDDGLIVPVIKHVEQKSILELALEIADISDRARKNKLALSDLQGGTFTLTSIGSIGGIFSAPIVNYPEVAIMGIQKIEKRPVVRHDEIVIREMTYLSISCDHRIVDGSEAALFMKDVISWLENPARFMLSLK